MKSIEEQPQGLDTEEVRFVDYLDAYRQVPHPPLQNQPGAAPKPKSTPTSKANKTIATRRAQYGNKATSPAAMTKLQNRTNFSAKNP